MGNTISIPVHILKVECDYETAERCGASGTFQVISVIAETEYGELDITDMINQGNHYYNLQDVAEDLNLNNQVIVEEL